MDEKKSEFTIVPPVKDKRYDVFNEYGDFIVIRPDDLLLYDLVNDYVMQHAESVVEKVSTNVVNNMIEFVPDHLNKKMPICIKFRDVELQVQYYASVQCFPTNGEPIPYRCIYLYTENENSHLVNFLNFLLEENAKENPGKTKYYNWNWKKSHWCFFAKTPTRTWDTIYIDEEIKKDIISDLDNFQSKETKEFFGKHCIGRKRGYLFHGPPGTGKTSLIKAIAAFTRRSVHSISVSDPNATDFLLKQAFIRARNSVIVLEEVDSIFSNATRENKRESSNVTMSGLLDALDGLGSNSNGCVVVMTTNHIDRLDPALIRPGRVDKTIEVGYMKYAQINQMCKDFLGHCHEQWVVSRCFKAAQLQVSPARLQNFLINNRGKTSPELIESFRDEFMPEPEPNPLDTSTEGSDTESSSTDASNNLGTAWCDLVRKDVSKDTWISRWYSGTEILGGDTQIISHIKKICSHFINPTAIIAVLYQGKMFFDERYPITTGMVKAFVEIFETHPVKTIETLLRRPPDDQLRDYFDFFGEDVIGTNFGTFYNFVREEQLSLGGLYHLSMQHGNSKKENTRTQFEQFKLKQNK